LSLSPVSSSGGGSHFVHFTWRRMPLRKKVVSCEMARRDSVRWLRPLK
jgi:hypothetical protein